MSRYQFEGTFRDASWRELPSPEEVEASVERAIRNAHTSVFGTSVEKIDVSEVGAPLPGRMPGGYVEAAVVVTWEVAE